MSVWCGRCQTRNDGDAQWCIKCGAALKPGANGALRGRAGERPYVAVSSDGGASEPDVRLFDPRWLQQLVAERYPDRPELRRLVGKCRAVVHCESIDGGMGYRLFFLPERSGAFVVAPEDNYTLSVPGWSIVVAVAKDASRPSRRAIYYVESKPATVGAPMEVKLAQYEHLRRDKRSLTFQVWLIPLAVAVVDIAAALFCGTILFAFAPTPPSGAYSASSFLPRFALFVATALTLYMAFQVHHYTTILQDRDRSVGWLESVLGLPPLGSAGIAQGALPGIVSPLSGYYWRACPVGLMITLAVAMLWLTVHAALPAGAPIPQWEAVVAMVLALGIYPAAEVVLSWRRRLTVRGITLGLVRSSAEGGECAFEPWLETRQPVAPRL